MLVVLGHVVPVFAVIGLGSLLKARGLAGEEFFKTSERLVYFVFFPALLFWKIGAPASAASPPPALLLAVFICVALTWLASLFFARLARATGPQTGSFSQCSYRFNTYVGMAIVLSTFGEAGGELFAVLIGAAIPFINVLAVSTLIWNSRQEFSGAVRFKLMVRALLANPLILSCLAGLAYARWGPPLPFPVLRTLQLLASLSLPLALVAIGGGLTMGKLAGYYRLASLATILKQLIMPAIGWLILRALGVGGVGFQVAMIFFALPTATSAYILAGQLGGEPELDAATIVLSTLAAFASLTAALMLFGL